ncbi:hypothetical protein D3C84_1096540 [compost metagenome]
MLASQLLFFESWLTVIISLDFRNSVNELKPKARSLKALSRLRRLFLMEASGMGPADARRMPSVASMASSIAERISFLLIGCSGLV